MSLAELKQEITRLTPAERQELALQLQVLKDLEDPAFVAELTQAHAIAEGGNEGIDREQLIARLRAAGRAHALRAQSPSDSSCEFAASGGAGAWVETTAVKLPRLSA